MKRLFSIGDLVAESTLVGAGRVTVHLPHQEPVVIEVDSALVGAEELLISLSGIEARKRLYSAECEAEIVIKTLQARELRENLEQFDLGFFQNRFSSLILAKATEALVWARHSMPEADKDYEALAQSFAVLILDVKRFAAENKLSELLTIVSRAAAHAVFEFGVALRRERLFAALRIPPSSLAQKAERLPAHAVLCHEGDKARGMFVLLEGVVAVLQRGRLVARIQQAGEAFGEMALFLEGERTATLVAETEVAVCEIREQDMPEFHATHRDVFFNIGATLAQRLNATLREVDRLKVDSAAKPAHGPEAIRDAQQAWVSLWEKLEEARAHLKNKELDLLLAGHRKA